MAQEAMFDIVLCKISLFAREWDQVLQSHQVTLTVYEVVSLPDLEYVKAKAKYNEDKKEVLDTLRAEGKLRWSTRDELDDYIRKNAFTPKARRKSTALAETEK